MTSKGLITAPVGTTLEQAKEILLANRIEKLPITNQNGYLKGLITIKDIDNIIQYPNACKDELGKLRCGAAVGVAPDTIERVSLVHAHRQGAQEPRQMGQLVRRRRRHETVEDQRGRVLAHLLQGAQQRQARVLGDGPPDLALRAQRRGHHPRHAQNLILQPLAHRRHELFEDGALAHLVQAPAGNNESAVLNSL